MGSGTIAAKLLFNSVQACVSRKDVTRDLMSEL